MIMMIPVKNKKHNRTESCQAIGTTKKKRVLIYNNTNPKEKRKNNKGTKTDSSRWTRVLMDTR